MIRVTVELVPVGINELSMKAETMVLACVFPLDTPENQSLQVFTENGKRYAEMVYNLRDTIYRKGCTDRDYWELVHTAIGELLAQNTTRPGDEIYPGMMRLPADQEAELLEGIGNQFEDIQSIAIFGERPDPDTLTNALALRPLDVFNGDRLFELYPGYHFLSVAIRLDPASYKPGQRGNLAELAICVQNSTRQEPHIKNMRCFNGLVFFFLRPDGSIYCPTYEAHFTKKARITFPTEYRKDGHAFTLDELRREIKRGQEIYHKGRSSR